MSILKVKGHFSQEEITNKIKSIKDYNKVIDWLIIQAVQKQPGIKASELSTLFNISIDKVYKVIEDYNRQGNEYKQGVHWGGRRKQTSFLTLAEEKTLLEELKDKAVKGQILTAKAIKQEVEKKIGHEVSEDYLWDLFKRHKWNKKSPRPKHPLSNAEAQEDFKKNSKTQWQPPR